MTGVKVAQEALAAWGAFAGVRLVAERENAIYAARDAAGEQVALRLHRAGYRSPEAIAAELHWAEVLAARGVGCPAPLRTRSDALIARAPDGRWASVVRWVAGRPIAPDPVRFRALGREVARFHAAADALAEEASAPDLAQFPRWDAESLLGEAPVWGRFWENPTLTGAEAAALAEARDHMRAQMLSETRADIGLIHADLLADNVLDAGDRVTLIDFDDCGVGLRAYDLATALVSHTERPDFPLLRAALLEGYAAERALVPGVDAVTRCLVVRALASCGWAASRAGAGDPRCRAYAERALRLVAAWRGGDGSHLSRVR